MIRQMYVCEMNQHGLFACPDRSNCGFCTSWRSFRIPELTLRKRLKNVFPHHARRTPMRPKPRN